MGQVAFKAVGKWLTKTLVGRLITSYAINKVTEKIFGPKQKNTSPTYSVGPLQTQTNSGMVMPIIYGTVKCAGNNLWQSGEGTTVQRLVGFGLGKNHSVSGVRLNDIPIAELPGCSYTAYMGDGEQEIDARVTGATQEEKARLVGGMKYDAYLALTITASDKLSGSPNVTAVWKGRIVRIYSTTTTYTEAWSDNPAWCIFDLMTSVDGCDIPIEDMDIQSFITAAAYFQPGDDSRHWTLNLILDEKRSRQDWLNDMLLTCRSWRTYQRGKHGILVDKPEPVSQVFNVKKTESIQHNWQEMKDDYERIIIKYPDPEYEWQMVGAPATIAPPFRNRKPHEKTIEIYGITNFKQASQMAWFAINQAQTCQDWIIYECNKRALNRTIGDVVGIYDPITEVTEPGLDYKRYRIMAMTEPQGMMIKMVLREYNEAIYTDAVGSVAPVVHVTTLPNPATPPPDVSNIQLNQIYYRQKDGTIVSYITGTFEIPDSSSWGSAIIDYSDDAGETWQNLGTYIAGNFVVPNAKTKQTYVIRIRSTSRRTVGITSEGVVSEPIYITGKDSPPSNVATIIAVIEPTDTTKVKLSWTSVDDIDLSGYQVREGDAILTPTPISDTQYTYTAASSRQHVFSVVAVDNSGNPSEVPASIELNVSIEPADVASFSIALQETDRSRLILNWQANTNTDLSHYELRTGNSGWEAATVIAPQLKATTYTYQLNGEGSQTFMIKAVNAAGRYSVAEAVQSIQVILRPDAPTDLAAVQDEQNRSVLVISWTPSPGKDIAEYQLRHGTDWATGSDVGTTRETVYRWTIPASGVYTIMARAKTVAGYLSNVTNATVTAMIEAYDVTGFTATQSMSDRTKIRLLWDKPLSNDVAYHEIREGASWDAGTVIDSRATGTFYDTTIQVQGEHTYWIKAVTVAGKYSQNPEHITGVFSLQPNPVSEIQISQQANDKSVVQISWSATPESDLAGYQVKIGYIWDTAEALPLTKELSCTYSPPTTDNLKVMIKAVNAAGYYSDEVFAIYYASLEPAAVTGFQVIQNGEYVQFFWNKHPENDVVAYEIREGASFAGGTLIDTGITLNSHSVKVDVERNYQYHIKAINRSNRYSQTAARQTVYVSNLPPKNVILEYDEITRQDGTHSDTEFGISNINWQTIGGAWSDYPTTKFEEIGGQNVLMLAKLPDDTYPASGVYTCEQIDIGQVTTCNIGNLFTSSVNLTGVGSAKLQIRTSQDGTTWTAWADFKPAEYTFRYLERRVLLSTTDPAKTPEVGQFSTRIDVPDTTQDGTVTVPVGGISVLYLKAFYTVPVVTATAIGANRFAEITAEANSGHTVQIVDRTGADVGGKYNYSAKGY